MQTAKVEEGYLDKIPTLAVLMVGGVPDEEILKLPLVTEQDLEAARKLLTDKGFIFGACDRCNNIGWLNLVKWEVTEASFSAHLCVTCEEICQPPRG